MPRHLGKSIRPSHAAIVRAPGLLPMRYTLRELSTELDIPVPTLNDWRALGMPFEKDERGHVWIVGTDFTRWMSSSRVTQRIRLKSGEAFCMTCAVAVKVACPIVVQASGVERLNGFCAACNRPVTRVIRRWSTEPTITSSGRS